MSKFLLDSFSSLKEELLNPAQGALITVCSVLLVGIASPPNWVLILLPEQIVSVVNSNKPMIIGLVLILGFLLSYILRLGNKNKAYYACSNLEKSNVLIESAFAALRNRPNINRTSVDAFSENWKNNRMYLSKYAASLLKYVLDNLFSILTANAELEDRNLSSENRHNFSLKITEAQKNLDRLENKLSALKGNLHESKA